MERKHITTLSLSSDPVLPYVLSPVIARPVRSTATETWKVYLHFHPAEMRVLLSFLFVAMANTQTIKPFLLALPESAGELQQEQLATWLNWLTTSAPAELTAWEATKIGNKLTGSEQVLSKPRD